MPFLESLRDLTFASLLLRLLLAMLFGGTIGLERERRGRPAGLRTYMLVCIGASLTIMLSQYDTKMLETLWSDAGLLTTDMSRFGAQVINGVGFLGAGTILVTGQQEVKGLTTAACLWASACMGLAIGAGFYECVLPGFVLMFLSIRVFPRVESRLISRSRNMSIYAEMDSMEDLSNLIQLIRARGYRVADVDLDCNNDTDGLARPKAIIAMRLPRRQPHADVMMSLSTQARFRTLDEL